MWNVLFVAPQPPKAALSLSTFSKVSPDIKCHEVANLGVAKHCILNEPYLPRLSIVVDGQALASTTKEELLTIKAIVACRVLLAYQDIETIMAAIEREMYPGVFDGTFSWHSEFGEQYKTLEGSRMGICPLPKGVKIVRSLESSSSGESKENEMKHLTRRERDVLKLVAAGDVNRSISAKLGISENTVRLHVHNVLKKLGVNNRTQAAAWELRKKD